jgi:hypothetical protein
MNRTESFYLAGRCNEHACSWHHYEVSIPSVCACACTQITGDDGDGILSRSGNRGARGEDQVANSSGSVLEGGAGEEPVLMCCVHPAYLPARCLPASLAVAILRTARFPHTTTPSHLPDSHDVTRAVLNLIHFHGFSLARVSQAVLQCNKPTDPKAARVRHSQALCLVAVFPSSYDSVSCARCFTSEASVSMAPGDVMQAQSFICGE